MVYYAATIIYLAFGKRLTNSYGEISKMKTLFIIPGACSLGSMVALEWLGAPYQVSITTVEGRAGDAFRKINPLGKVAALLDGENIIYENLAILLYLVDQNPHSKIALPLNTHERTETYIWLSYIASTIHAAFGPLFRANEFVDDSAMEIFKAKVIERIRKIFAHVNTHLTKSKYFIGSTPTIVDAQAYGILRWSEKFSTLERFPQIEDFMLRMRELPAVKNALNIEQNKTGELINSPFVGYYNL